MIKKYYDQDCNLGMLDGNRFRKPGSRSCYEPA